MPRRKPNRSPRIGLSDEEARVRTAEMARQSIREIRFHLREFIDGNTYSAYSLSAVCSRLIEELCHLGATENGKFYSMTSVDKKSGIAPYQNEKVCIYEEFVTVEHHPSKEVALFLNYPLLSVSDENPRCLPFNKWTSQKIFVSGVHGAIEGPKKYKEHRREDLLKTVRNKQGAHHSLDLGILSDLRQSLPNSLAMAAGDLFPKKAFERKVSLNHSYQCAVANIAGELLVSCRSVSIGKILMDPSTYELAKTTDERQIASYVISSQSKKSIDDIKDLCEKQKSHNGGFEEFDVMPLQKSSKIEIKS